MLFVSDVTRKVALPLTIPVKDIYKDASDAVLFGSCNEARHSEMMGRLAFRERQNIYPRQSFRVVQAPEFSSSNEHAHVPSSA
jgi:hypothetical protein